MRQRRDGERPAERGLLRGGLGPGVDHPGAALRVLRPVRHEAPLHHAQAALHGVRVGGALGVAGVPLDDGDDVLRRRDVVVRLDPLGGVDGVELVGEVGGGLDRGVATAHVFQGASSAKRPPGRGRSSYPPGMTDPGDLERRVSALEQEISRIQGELDRAREDTAAARVLASGADRDVSDVRSQLRAQRGLLQTLRDTQVEQGDRLDRLERRMTAVELRMNALEDRIAGMDARLTGRIDELDARLTGRQMRSKPRCARASRRWAPGWRTSSRCWSETNDGMRDHGRVTWSAPLAPGPVHGVVAVPGSKSVTNRALLLAALSGGPASVSGAPASRDTALMVGALRGLGVPVEVDGERVAIGAHDGLRGGGTVDCGLAGTVMRFVPPAAALADGPVAFDGDARARERPMATVLDALRALGARVDGDALPFTLHGTGGHPRRRRGDRRVGVVPVRVRPAALRRPLRQGRHRAPRRQAGALAPPHRHVRGHAPRGRCRRRRRRAQHLAGRARRDPGARLGRRTRPLQRRRLPGRGRRHRRAGHGRGLARGVDPARHRDPGGAGRDGVRRSSRAPTG